MLRIKRSFAVLSFVFLWVALVGMGKGPGPDVPIPEVSHNATVRDDQDITTKVSGAPWEGNIFFIGSRGKGTVTVAFEKIKKVVATGSGLDARLAELETMSEAYLIRTPIRGILDVGDSTAILRVHDLDTVYLRIPIPQGLRSRIDVGSRVLFRTPARPGQRFAGAIVDVGEHAINLNGRQIFWGSARVHNPEHLLRAGMTGSVVIDAEGAGPGLMRSLWREIVGVGI